ncbi:MAG: phosphatidylserine decarboxylase [Vicinamibacterales bacterium]|jgi:phosphatidylserine decarboxylase|nr:phosphatidylserine decarboxylase [Vicinamibacterales bacterium]
MRIDRAGYPFLAVPLVPAAICMVAGLPLVALPLTGLAIGVALFFRDPDRCPPQAPEAVVSPADGRVLYAGAAGRQVAPPGDWLQLSIFLSPLDVHVNRVPIAGQVTRVEYAPGSFLPAFRDGAAAANERNEIWLDHAGQTIVFRQIVGALARRVVCRVANGARVQTGQRFGIMKFGSRMDLFLPTSATLVVSKGDRVRAGETIVARLGGVMADGRN